MTVLCPKNKLDFFLVTKSGQRKVGRTGEHEGLFGTFSLSKDDK